MNQDFTLDDFRAQFDQWRNNGLADMIGRMPSLDGLVRAGEDPENAVRRVQQMIDAMTEDERRDPALIDLDATCRIGASAGADSAEVERLLANFTRTQTVMRRLAGMSLWQRLKLILGFGSISPESP